MKLSSLFYIVYCFATFINNLTHIKSPRCPL